MPPVEVLAVEVGVYNSPEVADWVPFFLMSWCASLHKTGNVCN